MSSQPPVAKKVEYVREHHQDKVADPYEWLRDKSDPEVIAHLQAENEYAEAVCAGLEPLRDSIFEEIKARTQQTDMSVAVRRGGYWYYARTAEGAQYATHCRTAVSAHPQRPDPRPGQVLDGEQVILDGNAEAAGNEFFSIGALSISPDEAFVAYATDVAGDERFDVRVRRIDDGRVVDEAVTGVGYGLVWDAAGEHLFYTRVDDAWRPHEVWRHKVGTPAAEDVRIYREDDERFWMGIGRSRDRRWLVLHLGTKTTDEVHLLDLRDPTGPLRVVSPRSQGLEYSVEPAGDRLLITHNAGHPDFAVAWWPTDRLGQGAPSDWHRWIDGRDGVRIAGVDAFAGHAVISLRRGGLSGLAVAAAGDPGGAGYGEPAQWDFEQELHTVALSSNPEWETDSVLVGFESMVTPSSVFEADLSTGERTLLRQQPVLEVDLGDYVQQRHWATMDDGTKVPLSVVAHKNTPLDGTAPGLLYGYGSYEICIDPTFSIPRLSLLDRGVVFAIAHIRGGGEMGRHWYDQGKVLTKKNTFSDFVSSAAYLKDAGLVAADRLAAMGGSAGGLLIGAAVNLDPEMFCAVHAAVPFVDALTTILNPDLPLTVGEWEEWGNPVESREVYEYMKSYTPYENITARRYPAILATTSLNDTRVFFTEPAKWVARLRETVPAQDSRPVLLRTEMVAGHGGKSGRYDKWQQTAWEYAFLLDRLGAY